MRPASRAPFPQRPCTERVDAPPPARRPTEAYPLGTPLGYPRSRKNGGHSVFRDRSLESLPPECFRTYGLEHYAVAAFAASALRLYIICCPMARTLLTSQ